MITRGMNKTVFVFSRGFVKSDELFELVFDELNIELGLLWELGTPTE